MLETTSAFKDAMRTGKYSRVDYFFLKRAGQNQDFITADYRYAEVDYDHPPIFDGVSFQSLATITNLAPPDERALGGRDAGGMRLADPNWTFRSYFDRNGWTGHRVEVIWDYRFNDPNLTGLQHQIVHFYEGITAGGESGEDDDGRRVSMRIVGPFTQLDPNLSANVTPAQQKGRRDAGDTSLDDLQDVWSIRIGRKPGE